MHDFFTLDVETSTSRGERNATSVAKVGSKLCSINIIYIYYVSYRQG